jgi:hypothetical protein
VHPAAAITSPGCAAGTASPPNPPSGHTRPPSGIFFPFTWFVCVFLLICAQRAAKGPKDLLAVRRAAVASAIAMLFYVVRRPEGVEGRGQRLWRAAWRLHDGCMHQWSSGSAAGGHMLDGLACWHGMPLQPHTTSRLTHPPHPTPCAPSLPPPSLPSGAAHHLCAHVPDLLAQPACLRRLSGLPHPLLELGQGLPTLLKPTPSLLQQRHHWCVARKRSATPARPRPARPACQCLPGKFRADRLRASARV